MPTGTAASHEDLDDDAVASEVEKNRGQSGSPCQVRQLSDGEDRGAASPVIRKSGVNTLAHGNVALINNRRNPLRALFQAQTIAINQPDGPAPSRQESSFRLDAAEEGL